MKRITLLFAVLLAAPAQATSFDGNCAGTGWARYTNAGFVPKALTWPAETVAACTGKLDGQRVNSAPTRVRLLFRDQAAGCATIDAVATVELRFLNARLRVIKSKRPIAFESDRMLTPVFTAPGLVGYFTAFLNTAEFE